MRILAIETSGRHGSVATLLGRGGQLRDWSAKRILSGERRTAQVARPGAASSCWPTPAGRRSRSSWSPSPSGLARSPVCESASRRPRRLPTPSAPKWSASTRSKSSLAKRRRSACAAVDDHGRTAQELFAAKFVANAVANCRTNARRPSCRKTRGSPSLQPGDRVTGPALQAARIATARRRSTRCRRSNLATDGGGRRPSRPGEHYQAGQRDDVWKLVAQLLPPERRRRKSKTAQLVATSQFARPRRASATRRLADPTLRAPPRSSHRCPPPCAPPKRTALRTGCTANRRRDPASPKTSARTVPCRSGSRVGQSVTGSAAKNSVIMLPTRAI